MSQVILWKCKLHISTKFYYNIEKVFRSLYDSPLTAHSFRSLIASSAHCTALLHPRRLRARSGSLSTQGLMCKMRWPWELWHKSRCRWTLSMRRAKVRRDITKVRSEMSANSAETTTQSSFLYIFAPRRAFFTTKYHSHCIEQVWIQKNSSDLGHFILTSRR